MTGWQSTVVGFISFGIASLALTAILFTVFFGTPEERAAKGQLQLWLDLQIRPPTEPPVPIRAATETLVGNLRIRRAAFWFVVAGSWAMVGLAIVTDNDAWLAAAFGWIIAWSTIFGVVDARFGPKQQLKRLNK